MNDSDGSFSRAVVPSVADAGRRFASAIRGAIDRLQSSIRSFLAASYAVALFVRSTARERLVEPAVRAAGPLRTVLLGRRVEVSLLVLLVAPAIALATGWWVTTVGGYATLEGWVHGTWHGTAPSLVVFVGVGVVLALGAASAALNSGLLPTTALTAAPVFGASVTRYGTEAVFSWGTEVVSLPDAVGLAALFALAFGVPLGVGGFLLGRALRRTLAVLEVGSGGPLGPGRA